jgi:hypothetical protein
MIRTMARGIVDTLLRSEEPSIRWTVRTRVLGEPPGSPANRRLRGQIRRSPRVRRMLDAEFPRNLYQKWRGAHWVLANLADLGYPPGDETLLPLLNPVLDRWLHRHYYEEFEAGGRAASYRGRGVPVIAGRYRQCGSLQGNALRFTVALGLADERAGRLAERLRHWQWPDGGWNCDRKPDADTSSFFETLLPMRGLSAYAGMDAGIDAGAGRAASRAAEVFLTRRLIFRRATGELIHRDFARLHSPLYWHYDVLGGLVGLVEAGAIADPRCADALDLLEAKRLPDGGWPAEARYYRVVPDGPAPGGAGNERVDWGGVAARKTNEWVTAQALAVLTAAGRMTV